ncbi:DUF3658 domain-containing protein [Serpens gallinarum]|uniref:DUF1835 domain-containing protein n=1 Tax=Serpens gallinarum TaxID=2763075 RepID=A0ABR8TLY1_9PSED|nr:DUF3658 domain-containing protein [Serpens gallinarum]MBD7976778.1 DUF1835 domain-containing protein [Serpens gallinarum]
MWHLVCEDLAVEGVTHALGADIAAQSLRVLHDDLAVGPLSDIDQPPCAQRIAYWQALWPVSLQPMPDFAGELVCEAHWLSGLAHGSRAVTVWHGDSCSEQLLLARLAQALAGSPVELWEVACGNPQLPPRRTVSLRRPDQLVDLYQHHHRLDASRRQQLAAQWQVLVNDNAPIRLWRAGRFQSVAPAYIDEPLLAACSAEWQPLARAMAEVMARCDGFFPTDVFLYWRARALAAQGRLMLDGSDQDGYAERLVRLPH